MKGPRVWGWWGRMGWSAESLFGVELVVTMVMPLLKGEGEALVMEKFRIKLVLSVRRNKDDLKKMGTFAVTGAEDAFGFAIGYRANLKKEKVVWETLLMMCESCREDICDGLFVKVIVDFCMEDLEEEKKAGGGGVVGGRFERVVAAGVQGVIIV